MFFSSNNNNSNNKRAKRQKTDDYPIFEVKTLKKKTKPPRAVTSREINTKTSIPIVNKVPQYKFETTTEQNIDLFKKDYTKITQFQLVNSSNEIKQNEKETSIEVANDLVAGELVTRQVDHSSTNEARVRFNEFVASLQEPFESASSYLSSERLDEYSKQLRDIYNSNFSYSLKKNTDPKDSALQVNRSLSESEASSFKFSSSNLVFQTDPDVQEFFRRASAADIEEPQFSSMFTFGSNLLAHEFVETKQDDLLDLNELTVDKLLKKN